jgi:hypothetical protein
VRQAQLAPGRPSFEGQIPSKRPATPALALSIEGACAALGVSWGVWRDHVEPEIRIVRLGRRKLVPVTELQRWLDQRAERAIES